MSGSRRFYKAGKTCNTSETGEAIDKGGAWDAELLRCLRAHLGLTQRKLAERLGVRQQTVSEWEVGMYQPRGASARLLGIVAEETGFKYAAGRQEGHDGGERGRRDGAGQGETAGGTLACP